jgi:(p)ppGpp synthase/HD superfamily hydrolase
MLEIAKNIVAEAFKDKVDKGGQPYCLHLERVATNCLKYTPSDMSEEDKELLQVVAYLHDLFEDCPDWDVTRLRRLFGDKTCLITYMVTMLTKGFNMSYYDYIAIVRTNKYVRAVKLADLEDNLNTLRLDKLTNNDLKRIQKYHRAYKLLIATR